MKSEASRGVLLLIIALIVSYALTYFTGLNEVWNLAWSISALFNGKDMGAIIVLLLIWTMPILTGEIIIRFSRREMGTGYIYISFYFMASICL
ncbi:hypothetical protein ACH6CV_16635 [Bacillota bacterium Meth-B3]